MCRRGLSELECDSERPNSPILHDFHRIDISSYIQWLTITQTCSCHICRKLTRNERPICHQWYRSATPPHKDDQQTRSTCCSYLEVLTATSRSLRIHYITQTLHSTIRTTIQRWLSNHRNLYSSVNVRWTKKPCHCLLATRSPRRRRPLQ